LIKETNIFTVTVIDKQYYLVELKNDIDFAVEDLMQLVNYEKEIYGLKLPVLIICPPTSTTDNELIKCISKNENNPFSKADAFVISSISHKILAKFYIKVIPPERPTQFFNDKESALKWLRQYF